jgi:hypothetical protein
MKPYLGADVLVNVDAAHNNGSPVAPGKITALRPDGRVNVRVLYDAHPRLLSRHAPEHITDAAFHDTTDPAAAMRQGQYGAFWPDGPDLAAILYNQEMIMAAQDDINAAVTAIQAVTSDLTSAATAIQSEIANLNSQLAAAGTSTIDTSALNTAVTALQTAQAAVDALEPAPAPAPAPAAPTAPATPVSGSDTGSAA